MRDVAVLIATYLRPAPLRALLDALTAETSPGPSGVGVHVVVCDNDPAGSAKSVCAEHPLAPRYVHEPRPGIAAARNALLDAAAELGVDGVAFIDDDERPEPGWLAALLDVAAATGADVVTGPVLSSYDGDPPAWVRRALDRPRQRTGSPAPWPRTGNVLVRCAALGDPPLRFRDDYGLSGGEDTVFFLELAQRGGRAVWADDAVVVESVPASRTTLRWILRRAWRLGNTAVRFDRDLGRTRSLLVRPVKAVGWAGRGAGVLALGLVRRDRALAVSGLEGVARGTGMAAGVLGIRFDEYRRAT